MGVFKPTSEILKVGTDEVPITERSKTSMTVLLKKGNKREKGRGEGGEGDRCAIGLQLRGPYTKACRK